MREAAGPGETLLVAQFTAMVTSTLTVRQPELSIQGPGDLPGKTIGTAVGSIAADYLTALHLPYATITTVQEGYDRLLDGSVQALVFDAPTAHTRKSTANGSRRRSDTARQGPGLMRFNRLDGG